MTTLSYVADQVRRFDHDRFLTTLFAPESARADLLALYAFNIEIAKTREVVTEPMLGQMRLQWWRDALDRLYVGETIAHEVVRPLAEAIRKGRLSREAFDTLIDAREADLDDGAPSDLPALEAYAEATTAPLLRLALQRLVAEDGAEDDEGGRDDGAVACREIGIAWALTGLLRAVPFHARHHRIYLPQDRMDAVGVRQERLFDLKPDPGLPEIVRAVGEAAAARLGAGRALARAIPRRRRSPLLLAGLADLYLSDLRKSGWNPFDPRVERGRPLAVLHLAGRNLIGGV